MFNYEQTPKTPEYRNNYDQIFGQGKHAEEDGAAKETGKVCKESNEDHKALKKGGKNK